MSEQCVIYDRECINCGECDNCDLDSSKHCDNCGRCLNLNDEYLTLDVADFIKNNDDEDGKKVKIYRKKK